MNSYPLIRVRAKKCGVFARMTRLRDCGRPVAVDVSLSHGDRRADGEHSPRHVLRLLDPEHREERRCQDEE